MLYSSEHMVYNCLVFANTHASNGCNMYSLITPDQVHGTLPPAVGVDHLDGQLTPGCSIRKIALANFIT